MFGITFKCTCGDVLELLTRNHCEKVHDCTLEEFVGNNPRFGIYTLDKIEGTDKRRSFRKIAGENRKKRDEVLGTVDKDVKESYEKIIKEKLPNKKPDIKPKERKVIKPEERKYNIYCLVEKCHELRGYSDGYCLKHHMRFERAGTTELTGFRGPKLKHKTCTIMGCDRGHRAKGYCCTHYATLKKRGELNEGFKKYYVEDGKLREIGEFNDEQPS